MTDQASSRLDVHQPLTYRTDPQPPGALVGEVEREQHDRYVAGGEPFELGQPAVQGVRRAQLPAVDGEVWMVEFEDAFEAAGAQFQNQDVLRFLGRPRSTGLQAEAISSLDHQPPVHPFAGPRVVCTALLMRPRPHAGDTTRFQVRGGRAVGPDGCG